MNTRARCESTVRTDRVRRAAIARLVMPPAASAAISRPRRDVRRHGDGARALDEGRELADACDGTGRAVAGADAAEGGGVSEGVGCGCG